MKRTVLFITTLICLSGTFAFGIAPIGQPGSNLRKGWVGLGADVSISQIDLDVESNTSPSFFDKGTIDNLDINMILGKLSYGLKDNWEVFVGLGLAQTGSFDAEKTEPWGNNPLYKQKEVFNFEGDSGQAAQVGTKYTFYEKALVKAGVACQLTYLSSSGTLTEDVYQEDLNGNRLFISTSEADVDSDLWIFQMAPGISYEVSFGYSIYGGPLFQWVNGSAKTKSKSGNAFRTSTDIDISNNSSFGAWVGLHADIDVFTSLNLEYQMTGSSSTIGLNLTTKF